MSLLKYKRQLAIKACDLFQAHRWWSRLDQWQGIVTLNYHRIGDPHQTPIDPGVFSASAEQFEDQLKYLKSECDVIGVGEISDALRPGSKRRCVLITFDDGYLDNYQIAYPILKQVGVPAVIFLTTGFLDQRTVSWWDEIAWIVKNTQQTEFKLPDSWEVEPFSLANGNSRLEILRLLRLAKLLPPPEMQKLLNDLAEAAGTGRAPQTAETAPWLTWDMVREMRRGGIDFGGHTVTHPVLSFCTVEQQRNEIMASKQRIEQELGEPITAFSYPIGQPWSFNSDSVRLVQDAGYQYAFSFYPGYSTYGSDKFDLRRVAIEPRIELQEIKAIVQMPRLFTL